MRLIDADALNEALGIGEDCTNCQYSVFAGFCSKGSDFVNACEAIADAPTVDPVKHGTWIYTDEGYMCTACEKSVYGCGLEVMTGQYRYCPNCGARMEE